MPAQLHPPQVLSHNPYNPWACRDMPCRVLRVAYELRLRTPPEVRPALPDWDPLPATGNYTDFKDYPAAAVELFAQVCQHMALGCC